MITPYSGAYNTGDNAKTWNPYWSWDISNYLPLMKDSVDIIVIYEGYQDGFLASTDFLFNVDKEKAGYFEDNRRIRCVKFRGHKSEGLFMPLSSLDFIVKTSLKVGTELDELKGIEICRKYVVRNTPGSGGSAKTPKKPKENKIIDNQFRFHEDTNQLYKNLHKINPDSIISISYKLHGTSGISAKILCKKPLKWYERVLKKLGVNIVDTQYDYIYSSRKVIKNPELHPNANHFYNEDIWGLAHNTLKDHLVDGMTLYYEIVGFLPSGGYIQKEYDYQCSEKEFEVYIYRITYTTPSGKVFEFSSRQVQEWCKSKALEAVPELWYGKAVDLVNSDPTISGEFNDRFLKYLKEYYNERDCFMCNNKVPEEGCVVRIEGLDFEAYKQKSNAFYERETKLLDKGEDDIESEN